MKSFRCGDVLPGCGRQFGGSEDEILALVAVHAHRDHGFDGVPGDVMAAVRRALVPAPAGPDPVRPCRR